MTFRRRAGAVAVASLAAAAVCALATSAPTALAAHQGHQGRAAGAVGSAAARGSAVPQRGGTSPVSGPRGFDPRPNILMITSDDAAPGDLPYLPNIEKLIADRGVTFTDAVSPDPICVPARASMLTGQYAHNHHAVTISGAGGGRQAFNPNGTLPEWLQAAGYDTMFIGKYLNGYGDSGGVPTRIDPGWNEWAATWGPSTYNFTHPILNLNGLLRRYHEYDSKVFSYTTKQFLQRPIDQWKPWFLWVNYVAPHRGGPIQPNDPQRLHPNDPEAWIPTTHPAHRDQGSFAGISLPHEPNMFKTEPTEPGDGPPMSRTRRQMVRLGYQQRLEAEQSVDRGVAQTIATLKQTGQLANTVVIFNSDNGFLTGQHDRYGKLIHFNDSEQVPMVMAGPGIPHGTRVGTAVGLPDLATTIAAIAHARPTRPQDGVNFLPWLTKGYRDHAIPVEAYPVKGGTTPIYTGVREGPWTYVHWNKYGGAEEMYDRSKDPFELHNLALDPAYRPQLRYFRRLDRRYRDCAGASCPKAFTRPSRLPQLYGKAH